MPKIQVSPCFLYPGTKARGEVKRIMDATTICTQVEWVYCLRTGKKRGRNATAMQCTMQADEKAIPSRSQTTFFIGRGIPDATLIVYNGPR